MNHDEGEELFNLYGNETRKPNIIDRTLAVKLKLTKSKTSPCKISKRFKVNRT